MEKQIIDFRDDRVREEWASGKLDPLLTSIFLYAARYASDFLHHTLLVTCIWRSEAEDAALGGSGVHKQWRGIDVHADTWADPHANAVAAWVNQRWIYDPLRPSMKVALWEPHGTGPHLHFQTCHSGITVPTQLASDTMLSRQFGAS